MLQYRKAASHPQQALHTPDLARALSKPTNMFKKNASVITSRVLSGQCSRVSMPPLPAHMHLH